MAFPTWERALRPIVPPARFARRSRERRLPLSEGLAPIRARAVRVDASQAAFTNGADLAPAAHDWTAPPLSRVETSPPAPADSHPRERPADRRQIRKALTRRAPPASRTKAQERHEQQTPAHLALRCRSRRRHRSRSQKRGLNLSRAANDALRRALIDEAGEALADTVKARLDRLDKRDHARARELALIKEIVLLFVRVWFEYSGTLPDDDPDASANADVRFQGFLEMLAGQSIGAVRPEGGILRSGRGGNPGASVYACIATFARGLEQVSAAYAPKPAV